MNQKLFVLASCLLCLQLTQAWVASDPQDEDAVQCTTSDGELMEPGDKLYDDENCVLLSCYGEPHELTLGFTGCGKRVINKKLTHCHLEKGEGHYPNCCPQVVCSRPE